jgi:hypothetical protein
VFLTNLEGKVGEVGKVGKMIYEKTWSNKSLETVPLQIFIFPVKSSTMYIVYTLYIIQHVHGKQEFILFMVYRYHKHQQNNQTRKGFLRTRSKNLTLVYFVLNFIR